MSLEATIAPSEAELLSNNGAYTRKVTEIDKYIEKIRSVSQTGILIVPGFDECFYIAVHFYKTVRPEGYSAFIEPRLNCISRRFEDRAARENHFKLTVGPSEPCENSFTYFTNSPYRLAARFTFGRDSVFGESGRSKSTG